MIYAADSETTVVSGRRVFSIRVAALDVPRVMRVTIVADGRFEWTFDEPGWRPLSLGAGADGAFLWSARSLITLPMAVREVPTVVSVDEDLMVAFRHSGGWLLVCEASVRRVVGSGETARLELDDVVESALWESDDVLVLRGEGGSERRVTVRGQGLVA